MMRSPQRLFASTFLVLSFAIGAQGALITINSPTTGTGYAIQFTGSVAQAGNNSIGSNSQLVFDYSGTSIPDFQFSSIGGLGVSKSSGGRPVRSITKSGSIITMVLDGSLSSVAGNLSFTGTTLHALNSGSLPSTPWIGNLSSNLLASSVEIQGNNGLGATPESLPEPSSLAILGIAALGVVATRIRSRRRRIQCT